MVIMARAALLSRRRATLAFAGGGGLATAGYLHGADDEYRSIAEDALPPTYEPDRIASVWSEHPRCMLARMGRIGATCAPFGAKLLVDFVWHDCLPCVREGSGGDAAARRAARHAKRAVELRGLLTTLGPTFVKFGQMLSIRPDVVPPAALYELQKLCDAVPSYPTAEALKLVEAELGQPVCELFDELDEGSTPIAAASLGQVYRCRLRATGEQVALKVQRPDMVRAVSLVLLLLRRFMASVEWFKESILTGVFGAAERASFDVDLLDTFARASYLELDYQHEAANMRRFTRDLMPRLGSHVVHVPHVRACTCTCTP